MCIINDDTIMNGSKWSDVTEKKFLKKEKENKKRRK
jgi:hypothetical protein